MSGKKIGRPIRDLVGEKFNNFTVIEFIGPAPQKYKFLWKVRCICGTELELMPLDIKRLKSCGCLLDLTGKRFNRLSVLELHHKDPIKGNHWLCRCDCGVEKVLSTHAVKRTKTCGCSLTDKQPIEDYLNTTYGRLTVERYIKGAVGVPAQCKVLCECGIRKTVNASALLKGNTESCGCLQNEMRMDERLARIDAMEGAYFGNWKVLKAPYDCRDKYLCSCLKCERQDYHFLTCLKDQTARCDTCFNIEKRFFGQDLPYGYTKKNESIYLRWRGMIERCFRPQNRAYKHYGGRGITVCKEWASEQGYLNYESWLIGAYPNWKELFAQKYQVDRRDNNGNYCPENCRLVTPMDNMRNRRCSKRVIFMNEVYSLAELVEALSDLPYKTVSRRIDDGWDVVKALSQPQAPNTKDKHLIEMVSL